MRRNRTCDAMWRAHSAADPRQNRRGAIVVMAGVFIVAIMLVAAIAVDASRIFAAKNELQTASDAAALAGAQALLEDAATADDTARVFARRNRVEQDSITSVNVVYGVWRPAERQFIAGGEPRDAMMVSTSHALPLSLARVLGDSTVTVTASAVAWSSVPVADSRCAAPLAIPYGELLDVLGYPRWSDMDLTDDDIRRLREIGARDTVFFHYGHRQQDTTDTDVNDDDEYFPVDIDSTWRRDDELTHERPEVPGSDFRSYVNGTRCSRRVIPGDTVRSEPGNKAPSIRDGLGDLCVARGGAFSGSQCIAGGSVVGLPLKVLFWQGTPDWRSNSRALLHVKMLGSFVVTRIDDPDSPATNTRAKLFGHFNVRRDFGGVSASATPLLRPMLVR
ncbi:MAG: TadG family pilus assembly protein [Gemmatimonadaceae bacterium]